MRQPTNGALGPACQQNCDVTRNLIESISSGGGPLIDSVLLGSEGSDDAGKVKREDQREDHHQEG